MTLFHDVAEHCLPPCGFGNTDGVRAIYPGCSTVNGMGSKSLRAGAGRRTRKNQKSLRTVALDCFRLIGYSPSVDAKSREHFPEAEFSLQICPTASKRVSAWSSSAPVSGSRSRMADKLPTAHQGVAEASVKRLKTDVITLFCQS